MKKFLLGSLAFVLLSLGSVTVPALAMEMQVNAHTESTVGTKSATVQIWFKGVPPKKYKGKMRINYYKAQGGYIGVYLNR